MVANRYGKFVFSKQKSFLEIVSTCGDGVHILGEKIIEGYQLYIVEQWACDRRRPYNTVIVFTGDPTHQVKVWVINIDKDKIEYYPRQLELLFDSLEKDNMTRPKDYDRGTIFVTNLSTFPSSLNTILVPDGDYEVHKFEFFLNLNLRKVGCSGRSALSLKSPTDAQRDKFLQTYTVSEGISFEYAVLELVKLVQISLYIFGLFPIHYTDGFICDSTEIALKEFRNTYCPEIEIRDNLLDPMLVAMILSRVVSIRNKLNSLGCQVGKDPFSDTELFLNGVASFQKNVKINSTRQLDSTTIEKIYEFYNRSRNSDAIKVHKVLKSKFDDMSGSSNTTTDIETCNLEEFGKNVHIERLKYLWRGKGAPEQTYWSFHGSRDFGIELGKSFLRGVSGRTVKTGEAIRDGVLGFKDGVTGSLSNLVDKRILKDKDKITYSPAKSSSLPAGFFMPGSLNEFDVPYNSVRSIEPHMESDNGNFQNKVENYSSLTSPRDIEYASETVMSEGNEIDETVIIPRRSNSLSAFEFIAEAMSTRVLPIQRYNSFTNMDLARKQADGILPRCILNVDIQTYMVYNNLKQKESSLKNLVERLEFIIEEYNRQIEELTKSYEERMQNFKSTKTEGMEVLAKQRMVNKVVTRIDTNGAKLNYELGVLEDKLKEMEEFIDTFCLKVQILESKMPQSHGSFMTLYNLWSYIKDHWSAKFYKRSKEE